MILNFDKNKKKIESERDRCTFAPKINASHVKARTNSGYKNKKPPRYDKYGFLKEGGNTWNANSNHFGSYLTSQRGDLLSHEKMLEEKRSIHTKALLTSQQNPSSFDQTDSKGHSRVGYPQTCSRPDSSAQM